MASDSTFTTKNITYLIEVDFVIEVSYSYNDRKGGYASVLGVSIFSLLNNTKRKIRIHILHDETMNHDDKAKIEKMIMGMGHSVRFYSVKIKDEIKRIRGIKEFSPGSIMRLYLPSLLDESIKKIIHMDADTIVNLDIEELWNLDLDGNCLAAVSCREARGNFDNGVEKHKSFIQLGFDKYTYFNSGVLLLDLNKIRNIEIEKEAEEFLYKYPNVPMPDQDFLNYLFKTSKVKLISNKYNFFVSGARKYGFGVQKYIYHFAGEDYKKYRCGDTFYELYINFLRRTPWWNRLPTIEDINKEWIFPWHLFSRNSKIIVYGGGHIGKAFYEQSQKYKYVDVICVVDEKSTSCEYIKRVDALFKYEYDYVLLATENKDDAKKICDYLIDMGIDSSRIKWDGDSYSIDNFMGNVLFTLLNRVQLFS